jgi:hypothetical protein
MAVLIFDPTADDGYEILGEVLMFESQAFLNGFAPEVEEDAYLPQVKRKLIIRAEKITAFSHALRCDEIQLLDARRSIMETKETKDVTAAADADTDFEAECMTDCCTCCCCDTEEECGMEV